MKIRILLILFVTPLVITGQQLTYSYSRFGAKDGLLSTEIYCAIEDRDGFVWFGTDVGFAKFNGYEFVNYSTEEGLTNNVVFNLYADYKGRIWYMSFVGGIGYIENGKVMSYPYNDKILELAEKKGWVSHIHVDETETIHFVLSDGEYGQIDINGKLLINPSKVNHAREIRPVLDSKKIISLEFQNSKITSTGYESDMKVKIGSKNYGPIKIPDFRKKSQVGILPTHSKSAFVTLSNSHILYIDEDDYRIKKIDKAIFAISIDDNGRIWVGNSNSGIEIFENLDAFFASEKPLVEMFNGFNVSTILSLDNGGVFLAVENQGAYFISNPKVENFDFGRKLRDNVTALYSMSNRELIYSFESGEVYRIKNDENTTEPVAFLEDVTKISEYDGAMFMSSFKAKKKNVEASKDFSFVPITGRCFDFTEDSILINLHSFSADLLKDGESIFSVPGKHFFRTVYAESKSLIWLGGNDGLSRIVDKKWEKVNHLLNITKEKIVVKSLSALKDGTLVVTSSVHGIYFLTRKGNIYQSECIKIDGAVLENCKIDEVNQIIWVASNMGIYRIKYGENFQLLDIFRIAHNHGLASNEVNAVDLVGEYVYAATKNGLSRFKKSNIIRNFLPPKFYLTSFQVNGSEHLEREENSFHHTKNNIQISFVALCYNCSGKVNYRYKLKGSEEEWHYTEARTIRYPALSPGDYRFLVASANEDGIWSKPQDISFSIVKPFWKTATFYGLVLLLTGLIVFYFFKRKIRSKTEQVKRLRHLEFQKRKIIEAKLIALRAQMNPHFTFNTLNGIQNAILNSSLSEATDYISKFSVLLRKILEGSEKMHNSISEELDMLKLYMELENLRFSNSIQFTFNIASSINQEFVEIPSMVIQPFVENAIVHGLSGKQDGVKKLEISMVENETEVECCVIDNGIGRVKAEEIKNKNGIPHISLGIKIANERLELLKSREDENEFFTQIIDDYNSNGEAIGTTVKIKFNKR